MSGQQVDILWFENMGVFSEPIFNFSFVRLTLKQVGTLFGGLLFAYALAAGVNQIAGGCVACLALLITFYRPRVMTFEQYVVAAMRFLVAKNRRVAEKNRVAALMGGNEVAQVEPRITELARARSVAREKKGKARLTGNGPFLSLFEKRETPQTIGNRSCKLIHRCSEHQSRHPVAIFRVHVVFSLQMTGHPSRCGVCGKFFDSRKALRRHKDQEHRITDGSLIQSG